MKILFCINRLCGGGAENALLHLVNHLDPQLYEITVLTFLDGGVYEKELAPHVRHESLIRCKNTFVRRILSDIVSYIVPPRWLYRLLVKEKYDVEVAFLEGLPTKMLAASKNKDAKKIAFVHMDLMEYFDSNKVFFSEKKNEICYQTFDTIACVSSGVREAFHKRFPTVPEEKSSVLYNVIDENEITQKARLPLPPDLQSVRRPCAVTVGRLCDQKGYDRLLKVHKRLLDEGLFHTLWILGEGEEQNNLEAFIAHNNLGDSVKLLGYWENPYPFMAQADFFVCSSRAEGFSTVATEAILLGLPVLTTDCAGMHELLDRYDCGVITENTADGLYRGLKQLLRSPEKLKALRAGAEKMKQTIRLAKRVEAIEQVLTSNAAESR